MRPGDTEDRVRSARAALSGAEVKDGGTGWLGRSIRQAGDSVGELGARGAGIVVDDNGRLRCPAGGPTANEFTDAQMSTCVFDSVESLVNAARRTGEVPISMARMRSLPGGYLSLRSQNPSTRLGTDNAAAEFLSRRQLGNIEDVPDQFLLNSVLDNSDKFGPSADEIASGERIAPDDDPRFEVDLTQFVEGVREVYLVRDKVTDKQYIFKAEPSTRQGSNLETQEAEFVSHAIASSIGLPVAEMRLARHGNDQTKIVMMQDHVNNNLSAPAVAPWQINDVDPDTNRYTPDPSVKHDPDNWATNGLFTYMIGNSDQHPFNFFLTEDKFGAVHLVPIDHGMAFRGETDTPSADMPDEFVRWASSANGEVPDLHNNPGFASILANEETTGRVTRDELLDSLEAARDRIVAVDMDEIHRRVQRMYPDEYQWDDAAPDRLHQMKTRQDGVAELTRADFAQMLDNVQGLKKEDLSPTERLADLVERIKGDFPAIEDLFISVSPDGDYFTLNRIVVNEGAQGQGVGGAAMERLIKEADELGMDIFLTPEPIGSGGTVTALKRFYKRFGFRDNKGKKRDFRSTDTMIREAQ